MGRGGKIWGELGRSELYKTLRELVVTNGGERTPERRIKHCLLSAPQGFSCAASDCQSSLASQALAGLASTFSRQGSRGEFHSLPCTNVSKMIRYPPQTESETNTMGQGLREPTHKCLPTSLPHLTLPHLILTA